MAYSALIFARVNYWFSTRLAEGLRHFFWPHYELVCLPSGKNDEEMQRHCFVYWLMVECDQNRLHSDTSWV